jgi:hypothetical protein
LEAQRVEPLDGLHLGQRVARQDQQAVVLDVVQLERPSCQPTSAPA